MQRFLLLLACGLSAAGGLAVSHAAPRLATPVALSVSITQPTPGATVGGLVTVAGTSEDVGSGKVSVSIDGGPFLLAQGTSTWTFDWDTTAVAEGLHTVTARARQFIGGPEVFDSVDVVVANQPGGLTVAITSPASGQTFLDTFTVTGTSAGAESVVLDVDGGSPLPVNASASQGLDLWDYVFEPGSIAPGTHLITATATAAGASATDSISVTIGAPPAGVQTITYVSSVDGVAMTSKLYVPASFDPGTPTALVVHLHGGGGQGSISASMAAELDARGWIGLAPDGRAWGLAALGCSWQTSAAYVNSPDPNVGPGEQDILDAIDWAFASFLVDPDRVYLTGFSMGGRGTYAIGLKNPGRFAAIAPMGPASDMYEVFVRRPDPVACKAGMMGGDPGTSPFVDTMYTITSGRFLLENAYNLPVYHAHGLNDLVASNNLAGAPFLHGWHLVNDASWSGCHLPPSGFCFGHTPTLDELAQAQPGGYDWAYMFTPVAHVTDPLWLQGTPAAPGLFGSPDPNDPTALVGIYDWFEARARVLSPDTVVFKTYTDEHRDDAYWLELDSAVPWTNVPAAVRATRHASANRIDVELVRTAALTVDLPLAGLALGAGEPLTIALQPLVEPAFDPALAAPGETLDPTLVLRTDLAGAAGVWVLRDGVPLDEAAFVLGTDELSIGPLSIDAATVLEVHLTEAYCTAGTSAAGCAPVLTTAGAPSATASSGFELRAGGVEGDKSGIFFFGVNGRQAAPWGNGTSYQCVVPPVARAGLLAGDGSAGACDGGFVQDLAALWCPACPGAPKNPGAGALVQAQLWYRDPQSTSNQTTSLSGAVEFSVLP